MEASAEMGKLYSPVLFEQMSLLEGHGASVAAGHFAVGQRSATLRPGAPHPPEPRQIADRRPYGHD